MHSYTNMPCLDPGTTTPISAKIFPCISVIGAAPHIQQKCFFAELYPVWNRSEAIMFVARAKKGNFFSPPLHPESFPYIIEVLGWLQILA